MVITYQRDIALANEDRHFFTWEHPMVRGAMEMISSSELGNSALIVIKHQNLPPGKLLLEVQFLLEGNPGIVSNSSRYLPPTPIRLLVDSDGKEISNTLSHQQLNQAQEAIDKETAAQVIKAYSNEIKEMIKSASTLAEKQLPELLAQANRQSQATLKNELQRLEALQRHNPNIRAEELNFFRDQLAQLEKLFSTARLRLDSLRVVIST